MPRKTMTKKPKIEPVNISPNGATGTMNMNKDKEADPNNFTIDELKILKETMHSIQVVGFHANIVVSILNKIDRIASSHGVLITTTADEKSRTNQNGTMIG